CPQGPLPCEDSRPRRSPETGFVPPPPQPSRVRAGGGRAAASVRLHSPRRCRRSPQRRPTEEFPYDVSRPGQCPNDDQEVDGLVALPFPVYVSARNRNCDRRGGTSAGRKRGLL